MPTITRLLTWLTQLPPLQPFDLLVGLLGAVVVTLVLLLIPWRRRRKRAIGPAHLVTLAPPPKLHLPLLVQVVLLVLPSRQLDHLAAWYGTPGRPRKEQQLLWAGWERISLGAWVVFRLCWAGIGVVLMALVAFLLHLGTLPGLVAVALAGVAASLVPERLLHERIRARSGVMVQQLVDWLREVAALLRGGTLTVPALVQATANQRARHWPRLAPGLTDLFDEIERMLSQAGSNLTAINPALLEMRARCPERNVNATIEAIRLSFLGSGSLAETLERTARIASTTIARGLRLALERRKPEVRIFTVIAAFQLYVGTIFLVIGIDILRGLVTSLH